MDFNEVIDLLKETADVIYNQYLGAEKDRKSRLYDRFCAVTDAIGRLEEEQAEIERLNELLKEQQPKLLTLKETINAKYPMDVFCEIKGEERIFAVTAPVQAQWIGKPDIRYWTARPTEEQRNAEPWKDGESE